MNKPDDMLITTLKTFSGEHAAIYPLLPPDANADHIRLSGSIVVHENAPSPGIAFGMGHFYLYPDEIRQLIAGLQYALSLIESAESAADAD